MSVEIVLSLVQIVLVTLLVTSVLLQMQGAGLGSLFGSSETSYHTKRGAEKTLFYATIALAIAFMATSLVSVMVK